MAGWTDLGLERCLEDIEAGCSQSIDEAWLRQLRARLSQNASDPRAHRDLQGAKFAGICQCLGLSVEAGRERLLASLEADGRARPEAPADRMSSADGTSEGSSVSTWVKRIVLGLAIAAAVAFVVLTPNKQQWIQQALSWTESLGALGPVVFVPVYALATVLFLPGSILTIGGGFLFGLVKGTVAVSIASTIGVSLAFLLGRTLARPWVERALTGRPRFSAIDRAVEREGFKIVLLVRLSPVFPFNLLNYAFGVTRVRFRDYVLGSWLGMLPGTVLFVYLGTFAKDVTQVVSGSQVSGGPWTKVFWGVGLAATVAVTVFITRLARRALEREIEAGEAP